MAFASPNRVSSFVFISFRRAHISASKNQLSSSFKEFLPTDFDKDLPWSLSFI